MNASEAVSIATKYLPERCEPLQVTFYGERSQPSGDHVVVGDDYGTELRVRLSDGAVFSTDPQGELPTRFVNSNIQCLAAFIDAYQAYCLSASAATEATRVVQELRDRLIGVDPAAFAEPENWWAIVLEQAEAGEL